MNTKYKWVIVALLGINALIYSSCNQPVAGNQESTNASAIPGKSIYNLTDTFINQDSQPLQLASLAGKPVVMSMIFTSCQYACPKMTGSIKSIEDSLGSDNRNKVQYVLVSFDTELDTPGKLKAFAKEKGLDNNWILLHASEETIKDLSVLLDIKYEKLGQGSFDHSNKKVILNKRGEITYAEDGLDNATKNFVEELNKQL